MVIDALKQNTLKPSKEFVINSKFTDKPSKEVERENNKFCRNNY